MENLSKKQIILIGIAIIIVILVVGYYFLQSLEKINYQDIEEIEENDDTQENTISITKEEETEKIVLHITGAVKKQGIVTLKQGERIVDAIEQAGGLAEDADITNVNLAYIVSDGQKIYIPHINDEKEVEITTEGGENVIVENVESVGGSTLININTANVEKLSELPRNRKFYSTKNNRL